MTIRKTLTLLLAALTIPGLAGAEGPTDGACDDTGLLVCAGMDLGANVACATDDAGLATCTYTYGWITTAYSPAALPGAESHAVEVVVSVCDGSGLCAAGAQRFEDACAWTAASSCDWSVGTEPRTFQKQLAMGECVTLRVDLQGSIEAETAHPSPRLASVAFDATGTGAGATCLLDDGR